MENVRRLIFTSYPGSYCCHVLKDSEGNCSLRHAKVNVSFCIDKAEQISRTTCFFK